MSKALDRSQRAGSDPIQIGSTKLVTDGNNDLTIQDTSSNRKKILASEVHVGDSNNVVIIKKGSDNKIQFQTQASGGSATSSNAGGITVYATISAMTSVSASAGDQALVTANSGLYVHNGGGWYKVATINTSPTISSPTTGTSYTLSSSGTATSIELVASDPDEGTTLQNSYAVTSGSITNVATVTTSATSDGTYSALNPSTNTTNRFFKITPNTNNVAGSFSLTFSVSDSVNAATTVLSFTLAFEVSGSLYFDGSGDFIAHASSSDFTMGTGDFTLEFWVNFDGDDLSSNEYMISLGGNALRVSHNSGVINCFGSSSDKLSFTPTTAEKTGWHHIALVRNGNTNTVYYDGQSKVSGTNSSWNHTSTTMVVGQYDNTSTNGGYTWGPGWLSNIRIVKGTAVYTSNFTPAAVDAISGTIYLIANNNTPVTITNGSTTYSGAGIRITTPSSSDFTLGTGDFTLEGWFNWPNLPGSGGSGNYMFDFGTNGLVMQFQGATKLGFWGSMGYVNGTVSLSSNTWYHVAWTRASGTGYCYLNGSQIATGSLMNATATTMTMNGYGGGGSYGQNGVKHSDLRLVKGKAVYTGNFSVPTGPLTKTGGTYPDNTNRTDPTASETVLLTHQDSSGSTVPTDNSDSNHTLTKSGTITKGEGYGKATQDASNSTHTLNFYGDTKFSYATPFVAPNGSVYFDGSGDSLLTPSSSGSSNLQLGTNDFTIEYWVYPINFSAVRLMVDRRLGSSGEDIVLNHNTDGTIRLYANSSYRITSSAINAEAWTHIALVRDSNTTKMYIDGVADSETYSDSTNYTGSQVYIGKHYNSTSYDFYGYISNYREVIGTAVYTSNFTVPSSKLTAVTNTKLLTCNDSNTIDDASTLSNTITVNNSIATKFSPF